MRVFVNCFGVKCMGNINVSDDIISLKGVGEKTATLYRHIGIDNIDELIHYFPRDYIKYEITEDISKEDGAEVIDTENNNIEENVFYEKESVAVYLDGGVPCSRVQSRKQARS